jgi:hypothetical protein
MYKILKEIKKEIKKNILSKYKFIKDYKIEKIYTRQYALGFYRHNSIIDNKGIPIIKLNITRIYESKTDINIGLSLYDILLTTILHELAHAIQNYQGNMGYYNEEEAEDFAYWYWDFGQVLDIPEKLQKTKNKFVVV